MTTNDRPAADGHQEAEAIRHLDEAIGEHARHTARYRASVGTSAELSAYMAVRAAAEQVAARSRWLAFTQWDGPAAEAGRNSGGPAAVVRPHGRGSRRFLPLDTQAA